MADHKDIWAALSAMREQIEPTIEPDASVGFRGGGKFRFASHKKMDKDLGVVEREANVVIVSESTASDIINYSYLHLPSGTKCPMHAFIAPRTFATGEKTGHLAVQTITQSGAFNTYGRRHARLRFWNIITTEDDAEIDEVKYRLDEDLHAKNQEREDVVGIRKLFEECSTLEELDAEGKAQAQRIKEMLPSNKLECQRLFKARRQAIRNQAAAAEQGNKDLDRQAGDSIAGIDPAGEV